MSAATLSRWARGFVAAGAVFLVAWSLATVLGSPRRTVVTLGLFGFVLHTVFGKAYSLVPTYFDREVAFTRAPAVHLPLSVLGTLGIAAWPLGAPPVVADLGTVAWALGTVVFLGTMGWTIRDNPTGSATGTSEANTERRPVDRVANAAIPVALAYLVLGTYETLAWHLPIRSALGIVGGRVLGALAPVHSHLLGAGMATVVLFAVGFRLLPRFTVTYPPRTLVWVVLPAGAVGPLLIATGILGGPTLVAGAVLESVAVLGFAITVGVLLYRSDRDRVGFHGVAGGAIAGVAAVSVGLYFALAGRTPGLIELHYRLTLLGFLGLTIVGVSYQFYPPTVGRFRGANDRTALAVVAGILLGLAVETVGRLVGPGVFVPAGQAIAGLGTLVHAALLLGIFYDRYQR